MRIPTLCLLAWAGAAACTRSSVHGPLGDAPQVSPQADSALQNEIDPSDPARTYAVVGASREDPLQVHQPAGVSSTVVDELTFDSRGISLTGQSSALGSSLWVEIYRPNGGAGWVAAWNLTEDVPRQRFCEDPRVEDVRRRATTALLDRDSMELAGLVSPRRGLLVRVDWRQGEVFLPPSVLPALFESGDRLAWSAGDGLHPRLEGSFRDVVLPVMDEVLTGDAELTCGELRAGASGSVVSWPEAYAGLNRYSFFEPSLSSETAFGWKTWVWGFEYLRGQPYLTAWVLYQGEIPP